MRAMASPKAQTINKIDLSKVQVSSQPPATMTTRGSNISTFKDRGSPRVFSPNQSVTQRENERPTSSMRKLAGSPMKMNADRFKKDSAEVDTLDPIYENKDPIGVTFDVRKDQGGILSVKKNYNQAQFFFKMELKGEGL
jgi:hypothetical protein